MKKIVVLLLFVLVTSHLFAEMTVVKLKGVIKGLANSEVVLLDVDRKTELARVKSNKDSFKMTVKTMVGDGRVYYLYIPDLGPLGPSMKISTAFFFIDQPTLDVNAKIENGNLKILSVKSSPMWDEFNLLYKNNQYSDDLEITGKKYNEAFELYNNIEKTDENLQQLKTLSSDLNKLYNAQMKEFVDLIPHYSKSSALMMIIYNNLISGSIDELQNTLKGFDQHLIDKNYYAKAIAQKISMVKAAEIGKVAPDFEIMSLDGKPVKLSSLKGQYVLIDFWASWCGPCRKEIPNLMKVYDEYKGKGLKLIGVSIDEDETKWRKAVSEEKLNYLQLRDSEKQTMKLYNYNGIPFIVLISPEGIILEKGLRGSKVREKVMQYMNGQDFNIRVSSDKKMYGKAFLTCIKDGRFSKLDSINVDGTSFSFKKRIDKPDVYRVVFRTEGLDASICVEPGGNYEVSVLGNRQSIVNVVSGKEQLLIQEHQAYIKPFTQQCDALNVKYANAVKENNLEQKESLMNELSDAFVKREKASINFLKSAPKGFGAIVIANNILIDNYGYLRDVYNLLDTVNYADSYYFKNFKAKYDEAANKWIQGKEAIDFITTDIKGKKIRLSEYKGRYILLDFWASWCAPCRMKAKELRAVKEQLDRKNIMMFSVSMDDKREQWEKATKEDHIDWINTSELKKFKENKIANDYKVTQLPTLFLLDPNGKIIKQNPTVKELLDMPDAK